MGRRLMHIWDNPLEFVFRTCVPTLSPMWIQIFRNCSYEDVFILLQLACVLLAGPCPRPVIWKRIFTFWRHSDSWNPYGRRRSDSGFLISNVDFKHRPPCKLNSGAIRNASPSVRRRAFESFMQVYMSMAAKTYKTRPPICTNTQTRRPYASNL